MDPINYSALLTPVQPVTAGIDQFQAEQAKSAERALQANQIQQQLRQQQLQQAALQDAINNPSPQAYRNYLLVNPQAHEAIKTAYDGLDTETQRQQLQDLTAVQGYLGAGRADDAQAVVQKHIDAAKKAGQDTTNYTAIQKLITDNPQHAQALVGMTLAGTAGADKMATTQAAFGKEARDQAAAPADIALKQAQTDLAAAQAKNLTNPPPKTQSAGLGPDGQPIFYNENAPPPANIGSALASTNSGAINGFVQQLRASENNTGNPGAKNPASSATGDGQFVDKTWLDVVQKYRPDLTAGKSAQQVLALRNDSELSAQMMGAYAQDNAQTLGSAGLPVNGATLAMAHKLGPQAAQAVLHAAPDAKLSSVLSADAIKANPQLANMTAGQYAQKLAATFGTTAIDATPGDPNATGDDFLKTLPPARARMIQSIANGDLALNAVGGRNAAQKQLLAQQVLQYDPTASEINLQARMAVRRDFTAGKSADEIKSLNTFAGHVDRLDRAIDNLGNGSLSWINGPSQFMQGKVFGDKTMQNAAADFKTWAGLAANEVVKLTRGGEGSEGDIKYWRERLNAADSPNALHTVARDMVEAVQSRLESLRNKYNEGMGPVAGPLPMLTANTQAVFSRIGRGGAPAEAGAASPPVAVNAQGQRVVYDAASRSWKPG